MSVSMKASPMTELRCSGADLIESMTEDRKWLDTERKPPKAAFHRVHDKNRNGKTKEVDTLMMFNLDMLFFVDDGLMLTHNTEETKINLRSQSEINYD